MFISSGGDGVLVVSLPLKLIRWHSSTLVQTEAHTKRRSVDTTPKNVNILEYINHTHCFIMCLLLNGNI